MSDLSSAHVQAIVVGVTPNLSSAHVQAIVSPEQIDPPPPTWMPLYVFTEDGWLPTFPPPLLDEYPPRG